MSALLAFHLLAGLPHIQCAAVKPSPGDSLQLDLAAGGLQDPAVLCDILQDKKLGLLSMQDIRLLNAPEQLELAESLRDAGVNLGSRSKLRRLSDSNHEERSGMHDGNTINISAEGKPSARRVQEEPSASAGAEKREIDGPSMETLAIAVTALLSVGSYILQAKLARDAENADKEQDRHLAGREKAATRAGLLLDR
jgi:hypothetical protein